MNVWPWRLLIASDFKTRLGSQVQAGPPSLSGFTQSSRTDGGGYWMSDLTGIVLNTPDQVRACRAWAAMLDAGVTEFILPLWDLAQAPRPYAGARMMIPGAPAASDDYFAQDPSFGQPLIVAKVDGAQPLRSTTLDIAMLQGSRLRGGEHFSLQHPTMGWRLYRVGQIAGVDTAGTTFSCSIRPPLREAVADQLAVEFDVPRYQAKIAPGKADDLEPTLEQGRWATVALYAVESLIASASGATS